MILRVRVSLPDLPGSLGQIAGAMGFAGADIIEIIVLERAGGRVIDDFIVAWPPRSAVSSLCDELASLHGAHVVGVWHVDNAPRAFDEAVVVSQLGANPLDGAATLVNAVPGIFSADWAVLLQLDPDGSTPMITHASRRVPERFGPPEPPAGPRAFTAANGTRFAAVPVGDQGLVLLAARTAAPPFHETEVVRMTQLVTAAVALLGDRLDGLPDPVAYA